MFAELLLEIGTEEIPSGYLKQALRDFRQLTDTLLTQYHVGSGGLYTYGTPRRLCLIGKAIADRQEDLVHEVTGPPKTVAYDMQGKPTKAAIGFAQRQGVSVEDLQSVETAKGEYLYVKRRIPGRPARDILAENLPRLLGEIPWPKSMRWGEVNFSFARPIHWILALLNGEVIPFEVAGIKSGNTTRGHRFMAPEGMEVHSVEDYLGKMERGFVVIDQRERERLVERLVKEAAEKVNGIPAEDLELVSIVSNLLEFPLAVCGSFDERFLTLPDPVLITAMREHQRYFAVYDQENRLMPNFVAVNNTVPKDVSVVKRGHERVLRARLSDADFFFKEDRKRPLADRLEDLKAVTYQADLGTSYAKVLRFASLSESIAERLLPGRLEEVRLAARLSKCDLVTQMVSEFPSLQGMMGKEYGRIEGYPDEICQAIQDHYLPVKAGGDLPASDIGAAVGLADRMDTLVGCFAVGLEPTGAADPFALRRHALAIIRILEDRGWDLSMREFIDWALATLSKEIAFDKAVVFEKVEAFVRERYKQMLRREGYDTDLVEAVISAHFDRIKEVRLRLDQLKRFMMESDEFQPLALTFKRVTNILKKEEKTLTVEPSLFREGFESDLWTSFEGLKGDVHLALEEGNYYGALDLMARLRKPVDDFFNGVEVLTKDRSLRENRVGILQHLAGLFLSVADFSKFSI
jgi:glycyl-tRNA synthetase beta chain